MKIYSARTVWPLFAAPLFLAFRANAQLPAPVAAMAPVAAPSVVKLDIEGEEPTGVYFDRDTLGTQSALVWTLRLENTGSQNRRVSLSWRVQDETGRTLLRRDADFDLAGGAFVRRRELFQAPRRGAYLLTARAVAKKDGPDDNTTAQMPFAVVSAPTPGYRPDSFWSLDAPLDTPETALDVYSRLGARVLRSGFPLRPDASGKAEALLRSRLERRLGTFGFWDVSASDGASPDTLRPAFEDALRRFSPVRAWELSGAGAENASGALSEAASRVVGAGANAAPLVLPLRDGAPLPGARTTLPSSGQATPRSFATAWPNAFGVDVPSASAFRSLQTRGAQAKTANGALYVRRAIPVADNARAAAAALVQEYLLAIAAGARGLSEPLDVQVGPDSDAGLARMARGAAFAAMTRLLENALFEENVLNSPVLWASTFQTPQGAVATIWAAPRSGNLNATRGELSLKLQEATLLDEFGNTIGRADRGRLRVPLDVGPVYLQSAGTPTSLSDALRSAQLSDARVLDAQLLPLTQRRATVRAGDEAPPLTLRVRLFNAGLASQEGVLRVRLPQSKRGGEARFKLAPNESKIYPFTLSDLDPRKPLPIDKPVRARIEVDAGASSFDVSQDAPLETATSVKRGESVRVDGDLSDWRDAAWMRLPSNAPRRSGPQVALCFDAQNLYVAARVEEPNLSPRRFDEREYRFWQQHDALQIAFGLRDEPNVKPSTPPFRDTDHGFLLSPFGVSGDGTVQGRVLKLWNTSGLPFGQTRDLVRYGGALDGSRLAIGRDATGRFTTYEAAIPLSAMPSLKPDHRARTDGPVRFTWVLHQDDAPPLEWARAANVFPYWRNSVSLLPVGTPYLPAQTTLGFTLAGPLDPGPKMLPPVAPIVVAPPISVRPLPTPRAVPVGGPPASNPPISDPPISDQPANTDTTTLPPMLPGSLPPMDTNSLPPASGELPPASGELPPSLPQ